MRYHETAPPPHLRDAVVCFWAVGGNAPEDGLRHPVLPDGCFDLLIPLSGRVRRSGAERLEAAHVIGPMTRSIEVEMGGAVDLVGVRFRPGVASSLFPLAALRDQAVQASDLVADLEPLTEALRAPALARRPSTLAAWVEASLRRLPTQQSGRDRRFAEVLAAPGAGRVRELASRLGLSERQLHRRAWALWGMSPAETRSLGRFRRALARVQRGGFGTLSELAHASGYADHAHLTREFVRFTGQPPSRYRTHNGVEGPTASDPFKPPSG